MGDGDRGGDKVTNIFAFKGGKGRRVGAVPVGGAMTAEQKQILVAQVDAIVATARAFGKVTSHQEVWTKFQAHFRIKTYHALDADTFARGQDYLAMLLNRAARGEFPR